LNTDAPFYGTSLNQEPADNGVATRHVYAVAIASDKETPDKALPVF
jgi:hypothetical protein